MRRGMNGARPRRSHPANPSDHHRTPATPGHPFPTQMASRRTSFPRLTAGRRAEGNENNEIQRSSVTYARRVS